MASQGRGGAATAGPAPSLTAPGAAAGSTKAGGLRPPRAAGMARGAEGRWRQQPRFPKPASPPAAPPGRAGSPPASSPRTFFSFAGRKRAEAGRALRRLPALRAPQLTAEQGTAAPGGSAGSALTHRTAGTAQLRSAADFTPAPFPAADVAPAPSAPADPAPAPGVARPPRRLGGAQAPPIPTCLSPGGHSRRHPSPGPLLRPPSEVLGCSRESTQTPSRPSWLLQARGHLPPLGNGASTDIRRPAPRRARVCPAPSRDLCGHGARALV